MELSFELPDGTKISLPLGGSARDLLPRLPDAKKALAVTIDGETVDLHTPLRKGGKIAAVNPGTPEGLDVIRHTAAHVLAQAVARKLGRDKVEFAIGPVIDDGFYYDFEVDHPFTPEFLAEVEAEMRKIVDEDLPVRRFEVDDKNAAYAQLDAAGRARLKKELVAGLPEGDAISFYSQGEFTDLCRGPHLTSTGKVGKAIKVLSVAAAYWRGDEKRESLQRVYATAFFKKDELDEFIRLREEAKKRDHRLLGKELALFHIVPEAPGHPIWLPNGMVCRNALETMMREKLDARSYVEIKTPVVLDTSIWRTTGHMEHYRENMFFVHHEGDPVSVLTQPVVGMKPMNCPGSALAYKQDIRSYRDLPLRLAEFGLCHRFEKAGVMSGLTRVRSFTQDDAHIYCSPEQLQDEIQSLVGFIREVYSLFGFAEVRLFFATRPDSRTGSEEMWDNAEAAIETSLKRIGAPYQMAPGDGAFYGPKIDFKVLDSLKREWQLATIQVDFALAEKFDLYFADANGGRTRPVVVHRVILGSLERMFAILIEHFGGAFPLWLAPEHVRIVPVATDRHEAACRIALSKLKAAGIRASLDMGSGKLGAKVRDATMKKVNYILVVGDKEAESGQVNVRRRDGTNVGTMGVDSVIQALRREITSRAIAPVLAPVDSPTPAGAAASEAPRAPATEGGTMRAVRLMGIGEAKLLNDVPIPQPGPGQVRIRVLAAGICGTDKHLCAGDATVVEKARPPRTLGHEFCGEIDAFGPGTEDSGYALDDYVTAEMHVVCGRCVPCQTGNAHACERTVICGLHQDGSFADYVVVPASNLIKLDRAAVPLKVGAFLDALGNAMHCAQATSVSGRDIAIVGYGPIGAMAAAVVEFMGAAQVFITEVHPYNLEHARRFAAGINAKHPRGLERIVVLDTGSNDKRKAAMTEIRSRTNGKGVDAALEISGHPDAINDALEMTRWGGDLVELGIGKEKALTLHDWNGEVVFKGKNIKGIIGRRMYDTWFQMLGLLRAGLDVSHLVTDEVSLDEFPAAMAKFRRNDAMKVVLYPTDRR
jgi:threonyl-tRNA synthetase